jgi:hypothetical protein
MQAGADMPESGPAGCRVKGNLNHRKDVGLALDQFSESM